MKPTLINGLDASLPQDTQLSLLKLIKMSTGSLLHQKTASLLQLSTIAATATFLTYVLGEMLTIAASRNLPTAVADVEGTMTHLIWILVIALLVCIISNITGMLISITRRFREIGTMKCLGAFDRTILVLFIMEALLQGSAGACAGALLGGLLSLLLALAAHGAAVISVPWTLSLVVVMLLSFIVVTVLCLIGAAYPSWQASRMLPVEAMRAE